MTDPELKELGIDPEHPFTTTPRRPMAPIDTRIGDDRLIRRASDGGVEISYGYYTAEAVRIRQIMAELLANDLQGKMPLALAGTA